MKNQVDKNLIHRKVLIRVRIYIVIVLIMLGITIYDIVLDKIDPLLALTWLIGGILVWFIFGRIYKIYRHEDTQQIMSHIDKIGVIFLIIYIVIEIGKKYIFWHRLQGSTLNIFSLITLAGLLSGRLLAMLHKIRYELNQQTPIKA